MKNLTRKFMYSKLNKTIYRIKMKVINYLKESYTDDILRKQARIDKLLGRDNYDL